MAFGFDPSIILAQRPADPAGTAKSLADLLQARQAMGIQQDKFQQALRLRDLFTRNAGNPAGLPQALLAGGFGQEGQDFAANQAEVNQRTIAAQKALQEALEAERRRKDLADPNSITSQIRRQVANTYGANAPATAPGNSLDDKEMELLERGATARAVGSMRWGAGTDMPPGYSQEAIDTLAQQYVNTGQLPQMGAGITAAALRRAVINRAPELAGGATPGVRGTGGNARVVPDMAGAAGDYKANTESLKHMQQQADAVNGFTRTLDKNIGVLEQSLKNLSSSNSPLLNKALRWAQKNATANPDLTAFVNAVNTVRSEVAKINSGATGSGGAPIAVLQEMEHGLSDDMTPAQIMAAIRVYLKDSENRRQSMDEQMQEIRGRIGNKKTAAPTGPHGPTVVQNGVTYTWNPKTGAYE
jgi:hypothetical protein